MDSANNGANGLLNAVIDQLNVLVGYLPGVLAILVILAVGWLTARLARRFVRRIGSASNRWLASAFPSGIFSGARMSSLAVTLLSELVFWATILITMTMAARFAELGSVAQWLDRITAQLPNLIAGVSIVVVGYFLSVFVREQFPVQSGVDDSQSNSLGGRISQAVVVAIAVIVGLDQVGIDVTLLIGLALVTTAGILATVAVAFASGARNHISNLIGARTAQANLSVGMTIRVGEFQGEIVELTSALVALETDEGRILVPGRLVDESVITVLSPVSTQDDEND